MGYLGDTFAFWSGLLRSSGTLPIRFEAHLLGLFAVLCVRTIWKKSAQIAFILGLLLLGLVGIIVFEMPFFQDHGTVSKGKTLSDIPWFEISLYFVMLLGMAAKYCYDAIGEGSNLNFQKWQLFKPMLVSPMVFG